MKLYRKEICEIVDGNGDLIGSNAIPQNGSDLDSKASHTTDYNMKIGTQPFRYDMMGRFGFTLLPFFEGKELTTENSLIDELGELMFEKYIETIKYYYKNPNKLKSDYRKYHKSDYNSQSDNMKKIDIEWANKIMSVVMDNFEKNFETKTNLDERYNVDNEIVEDSIVDKLNDIELSNKSNGNDILDKNIKTIAGLINKMDKEHIDKLINLLERK
jgi:hypothetical protein